MVDDDYRTKLEAKLAPDNLRRTMAFAGLYQMIHEAIKRSVVDQVREFFWCGCENGRSIYNEEHYKRSVLDRFPKSKFRASVLWLVEMEAITMEQGDRLAVIMDHRHDLTHELMKYVIDPAFHPDIQLMVDALEIQRALTRFWTQVEIDIGTFEEHGTVTPDDVEDGVSTVLSMCIDSFIGMWDKP